MEESLLNRYLVIEEDKGRYGINPDGLQEAVMADCPEEDVERARSLARPDPLAPSGTPISISDERWGSVRRVYVETLQDRTIPVAAQDARGRPRRGGPLDGHEPLAFRVEARRARRTPVLPAMSGGDPASDRKLEERSAACA